MTLKESEESALYQLKKVSVRELEISIAKSVSELIKDHYDCEIKQIIFSDLNKAQIQLELGWDITEGALFRSDK